MKILKKMAIVLALLIVTPLVVALFVKKDYHITREITINKPKHEVFEYIRFLKNQDNYSKWATLDPEMKKSYKGTDGTVGFVSAWESENGKIGVGEQEIITIIEDEKLETKLRFKEPFENEDDASMAVTEVSANETKVAWSFKGAFPYPMNLIGLFMDTDKEFGADLEFGLNKLKSILEKQ